MRDKTSHEGETTCRRGNMEKCQARHLAVSINADSLPETSSPAHPVADVSCMSDSW